MNKDDNLLAAFVGVFMLICVAFVATKVGNNLRITTFKVCAEKIEPEKCIQFLGGVK